MAKDGFRRLGVMASLVLVGVAGFIFYTNRPRPVPDSIIKHLNIPAGFSTICGVDKDGLMIHMKIILYDSMGNFLAQGAPGQPYACVSIPGMKADEYWVRLFK